MTLLHRHLAFVEASIKRSIWFWDFFEMGTDLRDGLGLLNGGSPESSLYPSFLGRLISRASKRWPLFP
jgi:hypothetical protein